MTSNFLADYREFTAGDEAPLNYHLWSGLSALSSIISRRVWINWGRYRVRPTLYVILLGPPGNGKNSSLGVSKAVVRAVGDIPFSAEAQTKESLVREMQAGERTIEWKGTKIKYTPYSIFATELSHFLGPNSGHMIDFLTTIFDIDDIYDTKTKNKGNDIIYGPGLSLLAGTTPAWITTYLKSDIISGGFTRRAIFINEDEGTNRVPFPEHTPEQLLARDRLLTYARAVATVSGEFTWDGAAKVFFADWYKKHQLPTDLSVRWYYRTKHIQILKVVMLVVLAESHDLVIRLHHLQVAMEMFDRIEGNLVRVFQGMGRNELHTVSQKLLDILSLAGGALPEKQVLISMGREANMQELYQVMDFLIRTDAILRFSEERNGVKRQMIGLKRFVEDLLKPPPPDEQKPPTPSP